MKRRPFNEMQKENDRAVKARPDCFAKEAASKDVRWFWPGDFDLADDHPNAASATGWFWKDPSKDSFWHGPFNTSKDAADAMAKAIAILGTAHRIAP